jgi:hypothetical protein
VSAAVNWDALAWRIEEAKGALLGEGRRYADDGFGADVLRRAFGADPGDGVQRLAPSTGLMARAEADDIIEAHTIVDRKAREAAEKEAAELRAELRRTRNEARAIAASLIRARVNEHSMPSRYRREGALQAADWLNPSKPAVTA